MLVDNQPCHTLFPKSKTDNREATKMKATVQNKSSNKKFPAGKRKTYRRPGLLRVGKARNLVQGRTHGKYQDGYSGYYWEG
jgi:hypothetical protein